MKVIFLGTAGLVPGIGLQISGRRGMLSIVIDDDTLLELGDGALRNINAHGVNLNKVKRILVSHLHSDHFIGIVHVLFSMMNVFNRTNPLEVIGPKGIAAATQGLMDLCELPVAHREKRGYDIEYRELGERETLDDLQTVRGDHPSEAHAFRIERNGRALAYNGESVFTKEVTDLVRGADLLICTVVVLEPHSFHIAPRDLGKAATQAGVKRVAAVHWPTEFEGKRDELTRMIRDHYDGEVIVPDDFTEVEV
ncbi:MAG: MBL fold metallo-hydrolase [Deltaproteobacteria bacterium]|nr:MBL fold metallo-hydrolase [Deltaproteobacteria bacterium]MBW1958717.1 MBL fold metallo-hydrolase [Deltaproteobacteria bacterium]